MHCSWQNFVLRRHTCYTCHELAARSAMRRRWRLSGGDETIDWWRLTGLKKYTRWRACHIERTPGLANSKRFPVVMRLCRRVEATWRRETQRKVEGKPQGTHSMERAVFIPEWTGATRGVRISVTVEKLKQGPRLPPGTQRLWAAGSPAMVQAVAAVMREVQQEGGGHGEVESASGDVDQTE